RLRRPRFAESRRQVRLGPRLSYKTTGRLNPFKIISRDIPASIIPNATFTRVGVVTFKTLVPSNAPPATPMIRGAARRGCTSPLRRYTDALAAALTPIMKLLVGDAPLTGTLLTRFSVGTLMIPPPTLGNSE